MNAAALLLASALLSPAGASVMDTFGAGAAATAMGGGVLSPAVDSGGVFSNPAALPQVPGEHEFLASYALVRSRFEPIPELWWDTNRDGIIDGSDDPLQLSSSYDPGDGVLLSTAHTIGQRLGLGAGLFLPQDRILSLATFEPELPHYFRYDSRLQCYAVAAGIGFDLFYGLSVGAGFRMIPQALYSIDGTLDVHVTAASEGDEEAADLVESVEVDIHQMRLDLIPDFAPLLGFTWEAGRAWPALRGLTLSGAWRGTVGLPVDVDADLQVNIHGDDIGDLEDMVIPVDLGLVLDVYDQYLPHQLSLGATWTWKDRLTAHAEVRHTFWSAFDVNITETTALRVEAPLVEISDDVLVEGNQTTITWRDTWSWRVGGQVRIAEIPLEGRLHHLGFRARAGGGKEPSPLVDQTAASVLLDSDVRVLAGGLGVEHRAPFRDDATMHWDLFGQHHHLASGDLKRHEPSEPTAGYPLEADAEGFTHIPFGGDVWTAGAQWSLHY